MNNRGEFLNLLSEVRGRIDELESLVRFGPHYAIPSPQSFEEQGVEDITPTGYRQFQKDGLKRTGSLNPLMPVGGFIQFAAPISDMNCEVADFPLSDLHRNDSTPGFGLTMIPIGEKQDWFAFEFLCPDIDPKLWRWTEWVVKISAHAPGTLFSQFILDGEGDPSFVAIGAHQVTEYGTFFHFRLDREMIASDRLTAMQKVRLVLSTGGIMLGLNVYAFAVYGRR